jgi:hypothetical protein
MTFDKVFPVRFAPLLLIALVPHACVSAEPIDNETLQAVERELALDAEPTPQAPSPSSTVTGIVTVPATDVPTALPTDTAPAESTAPPSSSLPPPTTPPSETAPPVPTASPPVSVTPTVPTPTDSGTAAPSVTAEPTATMGAGGAPAIPTGAGGGLADGGVPVACEMPATDVPQAILDSTQVAVTYITYDMNVMGQVQFGVRIQNEATMTLPLGDITVRYWLVVEEDVVYEIVLDSVGQGVTGAEASVGTTTDGREYIEITYPAVDLLLGGNADRTNVNVRLQASGNVQFDNSNDWSWAPAEAGESAVWGPNPNITVYRRGALVAGTEPPCE